MDVQRFVLPFDPARKIVRLYGEARLFCERTELAGSFTCYAVDSRCHGQSGGSGALHYRDMAADMLAFLDELDLRDAIFYGFSDGGIVGLMTAARTDRVTALITSGANTNPTAVKLSLRLMIRGMYFFKKDPKLELMLTEPHISPESLRQIACPVLITAGEKDLVLPGETRRIASALPRCRLVIVEGADHGSYIRDGGIMGDLLLRFLEHPPEGPSLS